MTQKTTDAVIAFKENKARIKAQAAESSKAHKTKAADSKKEKPGMFNPDKYKLWV